jgi:hypothetical protein
LSYSRDDISLAKALESALDARDVPVFRDERSITAGQGFFGAIEKGIRDCRGVVVLVTASSATSQWVTYEYAFAKGARVPVVAVRVRRAKIPGPIQHFQVVEHTDAESAAKKIDDGILAQSRAAARERLSTPTLMAKFQEVDGELLLASDDKPPSICMDLWLEHVPPATRSVAFEILDLGFRDEKWTVRRKKRDTTAAREFLTDDMNSYGDVEIWARGVGPGTGSWSHTSGLYEALERYYRDRFKSTKVRRALKQIREN